MSIELGIVDELYERKEEKVVVFQHKVGFDFIEDLAIVRFQGFAEVVVHVIPVYYRKWKFFLQIRSRFFMNRFY